MALLTRKQAMVNTQKNGQNLTASMSTNSGVCYPYPVHRKHNGLLMEYGPAWPPLLNYRDLLCSVRAASPPFDYDDDHSEPVQ